MIPTTRAASTPSRSVTTRASNILFPGDGERTGRLPAGAIGAAAAELMGVLDELEPAPAADGRHQALDLAVLELQDLPAAQADHVVVTVPAHHRLVARLPLGHLDAVHLGGLEPPPQGPV